MNDSATRPPSIKGSAFRSAVDDMVRLRDEGRLSAEELETALEAEDLQLLEEKIHDSSWYPVACHGRMLALLMQVEGDGELGYLRRRGELAMERLLGAGLYMQFDLMNPESEIQDEGQLMSGVKLCGTLSGVAFDFLEFQAERHAEHRGVYVLCVDGAAELPELTLHTMQGFIDACMKRSLREGEQRPVALERVSEDQIRFELDLRSRLPD